jgi:hypothetical protein
VINDCNGRPITDSTEKANSLNSYYVSVFGCERNILQIQQTRSSEPFTISINMIRKLLAMRGRHKSVGLDGVSAEILKPGREAMSHCWT